MNRYLNASKSPNEVIATLSYEGQNPNLRNYKPGYESFMNAMPALVDDDPVLDIKVSHTKDVMNVLAAKLKSDKWPTQPLEDTDFKRTIIAVEDTDRMEGTELIVAQWAKGFSSPIHGHADGYLHEDILTGKMRVNTYRIVDHENRIVRPVETFIATKGMFASQYARATGKVRENLVHNFTAVEPSSTLHYIPEHTRDGKDNGFIPQYFEAENNLYKNYFKQLSAQEAMYAQPGNVILVRSTNVPEYGDHWIIITGPPVKKEHGNRPQDVAIAAPGAKSILDQYQMRTGLILLQLNADMEKEFHQFHGIKMEGRTVILPEA